MKKKNSYTKSCVKLTLLQKQPSELSSWRSLVKQLREALDNREKENIRQSRKIDEQEKRITELERNLISLQEKVKAKPIMDIHLLKEFRRDIKILSAQIIAASIHSEGRSSPIDSSTEIGTSLAALIHQYLRRLSPSEKKRN